MRKKRQCWSGLIVFWLIIFWVALPVVESWLAVEAWLPRALAGENPEASSSGNRPSLTPGMGKEAVRQAWGAPENVRKIRTCFGWQEEWVYREAADRVGASERVLVFDEGEVLIEIK